MSNNSRQSLPVPRRSRRYSTPLSMVYDHNSQKISSEQTFYYVNLLFALFEVDDGPAKPRPTEFRIATRDYGALLVLKGKQGDTSLVAFVKGGSHREAFFNMASLLRVGQVDWKEDKWAKK